MEYNEFLDSVLPELEKINSFNGRLNYIKNQFQSIGSGSGRAVFAIDDKHVIKLAKNSKGIAQNEVEASIGQDYYPRDIVTEVFEADENNRWIIAEKAKKVTISRIRELTGIQNLLDLSNYLSRQFDRDGHNIDVPDYMTDNEFAIDVANFVGGYQQKRGDLSRPSSYGEVLRGGEPTIVITDYGLNDEVYNTYYNPQRKQYNRIYELYNYADGNDDILSDLTNTEEVRFGMWAMSPYTASLNSLWEADNKVIGFINNNNSYPDDLRETLPNLIDLYYECADNFGNYINEVESKELFVKNLLTLQEFLIKKNLLDRDLIEIVNENQINETHYFNRSLGNRLSKEIAKNLGLSITKYLGGGFYGYAYETNDGRVLKITSDATEAIESNKLKNIKSNRLAEIYNVYKIKSDSEQIPEVYAIVLEKLKTHLFYFRGTIAVFSDILFDILNVNYPLDKVVEMVATNKTSLDGGENINLDAVNHYFRSNQDYGKFFYDLVDIKKELLKHGIQSNDFANPMNLGYKKTNHLAFFDIGSSETTDNKEDIGNINVSEDGSAKFSTDSSMGSDDFPTYNKFDDSPVTDNNIPRNLNDDLEYSRVGDATKDEYLIDEDVQFYSMDDDFDEDGYDYEDISKQAHDLANESDVRILSGKELSGFVIEDDKVIGAIFTELDQGNKEFSFDIVVDDEHQNKGFGKELVKFGIDLYDDYKNAYGDELKLVLDVINPTMRNLLKQHFKFSDIKRIAPDRYEMSLDERVKSFMPNSMEVSVKKRCRLGGKGNTSDACNQGDMNNLDLKRISEGNEDDVYELMNSLPYEIFSDIKDKKKVVFNKIDPHQYKRALDEFIRYGEFMRFPAKIINKWKNLITYNIVLLSTLTEIHGHGQAFPFDEFYDVFEIPEEKQDHDFGNAYEILDDQYDLDSYLPFFSNGQPVLSDYGIEPLYKLLKVLIDQDSPEDIIVSINKILDVAHQRSDLAELFIKGGYESQYAISNDGTLDEDVGDKYLQKNYNMKPEFDAFNNKYNKMKAEKEGTIIYNDNDIVLVKNPPNFNNIPSDARGVIDKDGNLYVNIGREEIHVILVDILHDLGLITNYSNWHREFNDEFLTIQRYGGENVFLIGESMVLLSDTGIASNHLHYYGVDNEEELEQLRTDMKEVSVNITNKASQKNPNIRFEPIFFHDADKYLEENTMINEEEILKLEELPFKDEIKSIGGKIYSVGGAVRDEFLGKESKDLDILITGVPFEELENLLTKYGKVDAVGKSFGIIKFKPKGSSEEIDVAIPRTEKVIGTGHKGFDVTSDHNLPIEDDLFRRDFSINAIAKDMDGNIIDPYNGMDDLKSKTIRLVNPEAFSDDPLRMLRGVGFASRFNFTIEPKTLEAIKQNVNRIDEISPERILIELEKIVNKGNIKYGSELLKATGLLNKIFNSNKNVDLNTKPFDRVKTMGEYIYLLSNDLVDNPADFYKNNLKGDINNYRMIRALLVANNTTSGNSIKDRAIIHNMYLISPESVKSDILSDDLRNAAHELLSGKYPQTIGDLAVDGNDLIQLGYKGKDIGDTLRMFLLKIYSDSVSNNKEELLSLLNTGKEINEDMGRVLYSAVVLDEESKEKILGVFENEIPNDYDIITHHMTINLGEIKPELAKDLGKEITLTVVDYGLDDKVMAAGVEGYHTKNNKPHITIAVNKKEGGKPVMSNNLKQWQPLIFPFKVKGIVTEVRAENSETLNESKKRKVSKYKQTQDSINRSKSLSKEMKEKILKYVNSSSTYSEGGFVRGLTKPKIKGKNFLGNGFGADKNGFFVYTHRARSESHSEPEGITEKEMKFIESTG